MGEKLAADSVRISETEVDLLMARLDDQAMPADQDQRRSKRQAFRQPTVVLRLVEPGGNDSTYVVHPRNLSGNGIGFLHDNFMYPGTTCRILLKTLNLACVEIQGKVIGVIRRVA